MALQVTLTLPESVLRSAGMAESEAAAALTTELAVSFFQRGAVSFGQARQMAGLSVGEFMERLRERKVALHYDLAEYEEDSKVAEALR